MCENKVVMHEMISHRTREIPKLALEGKGPVSVASLVGPSGSNIRGEPILAVGCADGCIRLINFASLKVSIVIACLMWLWHKCLCLLVWNFCRSWENSATSHQASAAS